MNLYAKFTKTQQLDDDTLLVEGIASSGARDDDGEIISPDAVRRAIPNYLRADGTGPLREMHQLKAAGKTTSIHVDDQGLTHISTIVVDPVAKQKVVNGVYQGFSLGGRATRRDPVDKTVILDMKLAEISLVDVGSNPDTRYTVVKCDGAQGDAMDPTSTPAPAEPTKPADPATPPAAPTPAAPTPAPVAPTPAPAQPSAPPAPEGEVKKTGKAGDIQKGMWTVMRTAELFAGLESLIDSCQYEADVEEDESPVPNQLRAVLRDFATAFRAMFEEEISEALDDDSGTITRAVKAGALLKSLAAGLKEASTKKPLAEGAPEVVEKAGAKFSKATKAAHAQIHADVAKASEHVDKCMKAVKDANDALDKASKGMTALRGAANDDDDATEKALGIDDLRKAVRERDSLRDELTKALGERDEEKRARTSATEALKKALRDRDVLAENIAKNPKGAVTAVAIDKAADTSGKQPEEAPKNTLDAIRKAQKSPIRTMP